MTTSHAVRRPLLQKLKSCAPFGVGLTKPKHFRDMLKVVWKNRDNLGYAWQVRRSMVKATDAAALAARDLAALKRPDRAA